MLKALTAIAALLGGAGVVLAAAAAHGGADAGLGTASQMLLFHAVAVIAACAAIAGGVVRRPFGLGAALLLIVGVALFAGDLALRAYAGHRLFPMAAPIGGTVMIGGWLLLAVSALLPSR